MKNDELLEEFQAPVTRDDDEMEIEDEDLIEAELADDGELDIEPDDDRNY
jgi:hypothetical protein